MKNAFALFSLTLMATMAAAQPLAASAPASAAVGEPTSLTQRPAGANPFTGKPLSAEALQRELELRKLQTALLEEQLRQVSLEEEGRHISTRKQAEAANAVTSLAREKLTQVGIEKEIAAAKAAAAPAARPDASLRSPAKSKAVKAEAPKEEAPVKATKPSITVLSVLHSGGKGSAILEIGADVVSVEDGQSTPYGVVRITPDGVQLNERSLVVSDSTIGRVRRQDDEAMNSRAGVAIARGGDAPVAGSNSSGPVTQLPPLVLPPAVRAPAAVPGQAVVSQGISPSRLGTSNAVQLGVR